MSFTDTESILRLTILQNVKQTNSKFEQQLKKTNHQISSFSSYSWMEVP